MYDIDAILRQITTISARIDELALDDPARVELEAEREMLRADARRVVGPGATPGYLEYELTHLERRLAELDGEAIRPPAAAHNPMAQVDHEAFSRRINDLLASKTESERTMIERRIAEIRRQLRDSPNDRSTS